MSSTGNAQCSSSDRLEITLVGSIFRPGSPPINIPEDAAWAGNTAKLGTTQKSGDPSNRNFR